MVWPSYAILVYVILVLVILVLVKLVLVYWGGQSRGQTTVWPYYAIAGLVILVLVYGGGQSKGQITVSYVAPMPTICYPPFIIHYPSFTTHHPLDYFAPTGRFLACFS